MLTQLDSKTLQIGVIGLGVGERHVASYRAIPGCAVRALCDLDRARLAEVAARHGVRQTHTDWRDLVADPDIDIVSICSYDDAHAEQAIAAFRAGKHVMVEKPVATDPDQADALVEAYLASGRLITSNLILRRSPRFAALQARIAAGELGALTLLEGDYVHQVQEKIVHGWRGRISFYSPIFGGGIHMIDLLRWLAGERVVEVAAMGAAKATSGTGYPFDDTNLVLLRFQSGTLAKVAVTLVPQHPHFHALKVYGTRATFENRMGNALLYRGTGPGEVESLGEAYPGYDKGDLLPDFVAAVRSGGRPAIDARDVFDVMDICLAAQRSRASGRFVAVDYRLP